MSKHIEEIRKSTRTTEKHYGRFGLAASAPENVGDDWHPVRKWVAEMSQKYTRVVDVVVFLFTAVNICIVVWAADQHAAGNFLMPSWMQILTVVSLSGFALESLVRIFVHRMNALSNPLCVLDVIVSITDLVATLVLFCSNQPPSQFTAVLRSWRILRLFEVLASVDKFRELNLMLHGLRGAVKAMFWAIILIGSTLTFASIISVHILHPLNQELAATGIYADCPRCPRAFATIWDSSLTFIQQIITGDSWGLVTLPMIDAYPLSAIFFFGVFLAIDLALMNLVLMVICDKAAEARDHDAKGNLVDKQAEMKAAKHRLMHLCKEIDKDGSGSLTLNELLEGANAIEEFSDMLTLMDIRIADLEMVFNILDEDESGTVEYTEFCEQLWKMKTDNAHTILVIMKHQISAIKKETQKVSKETGRQKEIFSKVVDDLNESMSYHRQEWILHRDEHKQHRDDMKSMQEDYLKKRDAHDTILTNIAAHIEEKQSEAFREEAKLNLAKPEGKDSWETCNASNVQKEVHDSSTLPRESHSKPWEANMPQVEASVIGPFGHERDLFHSGSLFDMKGIVAEVSQLKTWLSQELTPILHDELVPVLKSIKQKLDSGSDASSTKTTGKPKSDESLAQLSPPAMQTFGGVPLEKTQQEDAKIQTTSSGAPPGAAHEDQAAGQVSTPALQTFGGVSLGQAKNELSHGQVPCPAIQNHDGQVKNKKKKNNFSLGEPFRPPGLNLGAGKTHMLICALDYEGSPSPLTCSVDGKNMYALAKACGILDVEAMYNEQCSKQAIISAIAETARKCHPGDTFLFFFAGHGMSSTDYDGDEPDGKDENYVCDFTNERLDPQKHYLCDDEFARLLTTCFTEEVNIIVLSDCCHSGTICDFPRPCWNGYTAVSISGCRDCQTSGDTGKGGICTHSMMLAIEQMQREGHTSYSVGQLYRKTVFFDDTMMASSQDIQFDKARGCNANSLNWPLVPRGPFTAPYKSASGLLPGAATMYSTMKTLVQRSTAASILPAMTLSALSKGKKQNDYALGRPFRPASRAVLHEGSTHVLICALDYLGSASPLSCSTDGRNMTALAQASGIADIEALYDEQCTKEAIIAAIKRIAQRCSEGDTFLFFFAGHGMSSTDYDGDEPDGKDENFVCDFTNQRMDPEKHYLSDDEFSKLLTTSFSKEVNIIVVSDCCHSGSICDFARLRWKGYNAVSISGCRDYQTSGDTGKGGICTHSMLLAVEELHKEGCSKYSVGQLYRKTVYFDDTMMASSQDIQFGVVPGCNARSISWPLVPHGAFTAPYHSASGLLSGDTLTQLGSQGKQGVSHPDAQAPGTCSVAPHTPTMDSHKVEFDAAHLEVCEQSQPAGATACADTSGANHESQLAYTAPLAADMTDLYVAAPQEEFLAATSEADPHVSLDEPLPKVLPAVQIANKHHIESEHQEVCEAAPTCASLSPVDVSQRTSFNPLPRTSSEAVGKLETKRSALMASMVPPVCSELGAGLRISPPEASSVHGPHNSFIVDLSTPRQHDSV